MFALRHENSANYCGGTEHPLLSAVPARAARTHAREEVAAPTLSGGTKNQERAG